MTEYLKFKVTLSINYKKKYCECTESVIYTIDLVNIDVKYDTVNECEL
jgi:hypothetical protein